ncbi:hypothetical protein ACHAP5_008204 [Fusarium lateritium]
MVNATGGRRVRKGRHLDGQKFACLKCIRGNRSEQCKPGMGKHMDDLRWIRQRGRPQGARNNLGPKQGRKFCPENFTALSEDEVGRVPAEEVLLPVEGDQAQVANGQMEVDPRLSSEAGLASLQAGPGMFCGGAVSSGAQFAREAELFALGVRLFEQMSVEGNQAQVANGQEGVYPHLSGEAGLNPPQAELSMLGHEAEALGSRSAEPLADPYVQLQEDYGNQAFLDALAYTNGLISREEFFGTGGIPGTQAGYNNPSNTWQ